jgi:hypothetical protein
MGHEFLAWRGRRWRVVVGVGERAAGTTELGFDSIPRGSVGGAIGAGSWLRKQRGGCGMRLPKLTVTSYRP